MKEYVIKDGRPARTEGVERGRLLLLSKEEWLDRNMRLHRRLLVLQAVIAVIAGLGMFLPIRLATTEIWTLLMQVLFVTVFITGWTALLYLLIWWSGRNLRKRLEESGLVPGIYENGIELPTIPTAMSVFMPYHEVQAVRRRRILRWGFYGLVPRRGLARYDYPTWFFGDEGFKLIGERLAGVPLEKEPPDLVVYPAGGDGAGRDGQQ